MQKIMTLDRILVQRAGIPAELTRVIKRVALAGKIVSNYTHRAGGLKASSDCCMNARGCFCRPTGISRR